MKGYVTMVGYMGWLENRWQLFATEEDYVEAWKEANANT